MKKIINAIKVLSAEAVQEANSGHPGLPLGAATMAFTLWDRVMEHNPKDPNWINRDRFILSAGHGSALIYSLLHLYGYGLEIDDLKHFRQVDSKTPGHPEYGHTIGVETTTGPLGQGFANGVGMAMAEKHLSSMFNKPGSQIIDHYTYVLVGDGCLMEGLSYEAASLAGHLGLEKLIVLYDSNSISIEGSTDLAFTEDVGKRFEAMNWDVKYVEDGNDIPNLEKNICEAKDTHKPSLIIVTTVIGDGAPGKEGTHGVHGSPLGDDVLKEMKIAFDWPEEKFMVPDDVREYYNDSINRLVKNSEQWKALWSDYEETYPDLATKLENYMSSNVNLLDLESIENKKTATRSASGDAIQLIAKLNENFFGGSADLAPSNKTHMNGLGAFF
jgi:transketolase